MRFVDHIIRASNGLAPPSEFPGIAWILALIVEGIALFLLAVGGAVLAGFAYFPDGLWSPWSVIIAEGVHGHAQVVFVALSCMTLFAPSHKAYRWRWAGLTLALGTGLVSLSFAGKHRLEAFLVLSCVPSVTVVALGHFRLWRQAVRARVSLKSVQ